MRVLVTGATGFIGRVLVDRLLAEGLNGRKIEQIVAVDLSVDHLPAVNHVLPVRGSIAEPDVLGRALQDPVDVVFHLASVPGGAAEKDPDLGRRVNLDATANLLERLRAQTERAGTLARLVFASTIAVYGDPLPEVVDENTPCAPPLSYGAHKLAAEILVADAARRGWVQACSLRLPGVVARPGDGAGLVSAFMSRLFWALRDGQPIVLPVSADATAWWISVGACVDNLMHAATMDCALPGPRRVVQMPALRLALCEVVDALVRVFGQDRRSLVSYAPQPAVQRIFGAYPPLETPRAQTWGLRHDGDADTLVRRAIE